MPSFKSQRFSFSFSRHFIVLTFLIRFMTCLAISSLCGMYSYSKVIFSLGYQVVSLQLVEIIIITPTEPFWISVTYQLSMCVHGCAS